MGLTTDPEEARRSKILPNGQQETYVVLSDEELAKGFVRPVRYAYIHLKCGSKTTMGAKPSDTSESWRRSTRS